MENKYLSLDGLTEYDALNKEKMTNIGAAAILSAKEYSDNTLATAQAYTDSAVAQRAQVQIITWGADD